MDIFLAIALGVVTFCLAALGGHLATENKKLRYSFWFLGVLGIALIAWQAVRATKAEWEHVAEINKLDAKLDTVKKQNDQILASLVGKPVEKRLFGQLTTGAGEEEPKRRTGILNALRNEYILSHDNISSAMLAGLEMPPADWLNKRLAQLGESWRVSDSNRRSLTTEQRQKLVSALSARSSKGTIDVFGTEAEAGEYAQQLADVFSRAGWKLTSMPNAIIAPPPWPRGLIIQARTQDNQPAGLLQKSLKDIGIDALRELNKDVDPGTVRLIIGTK